MAKYKLNLSQANTPYDRWLSEIDKVLRAKVGVSTDELKNWPSYDAYELGQSVKQGAVICLESQGDCPQEFINNVWSM